ncbi:helix-turn-helix domain-containing protein [Fructilactobacillus hinvesii]|uniref:Helix-turn-helix domain-containing protein n=1 Tax=Fructilactobacillus hinvesii TaxID=2940300 RepID=A0ABY5BWE0_9LACO|nr:helix-turn-helix transcriptional regulator [Fructilactobacillus hinvesii]USS88054.1 helix-turn-helix domain-containing protein [Fructilactobacillus hinvesii]
MANERLGEYLRQERTKRNYSVRQLALQADVSASYISRLENGRTTHEIKPSTVKKLANGLRIDEQTLLRQAGFNPAYDQDNQQQPVFQLPLLKNPLVKNNLDHPDNLICYLPFLKSQVDVNSKYLIRYPIKRWPSRMGQESLLILTEFEQVDNLINQMVVLVQDQQFYLGRLRKWQNHLFMVDENANLTEIKVQRNLKRHLFHVSLMLDKYN